MFGLVKKLWNDESAISAVEYGIIAAVLGIGLAGILVVFKGKISTFFERTGDGIVAQAPPPA